MKEELPPAFLEERLSEAAGDWGESEDAPSSTSAFVQADVHEDIDVDDGTLTDDAPHEYASRGLGRVLSAGALGSHESSYADPGCAADMDQDMDDDASGIGDRGKVSCSGHQAAFDCLRLSSDIGQGQHGASGASFAWFFAGASIVNVYLDSAFKHAGIPVNKYGIDDDTIHMLMDESGFEQLLVALQRGRTNGVAITPPVFNFLPNPGDGPQHRGKARDEREGLRNSKGEDQGAHPHRDAGP